MQLDMLAEQKRSEHINEPVTENANASEQKYLPNDSSHTKNDAERSEDIQESFAAPAHSISGEVNFYSHCAAGHLGQLVWHQACCGCLQLLMVQVKFALLMISFLSGACQLSAAQRDMNREGWQWL